jgi:hypothetical protein
MTNTPRYVNPEGAKRYHKLAEALQNSQVPLGFGEEFIFTLSPNLLDAHITFARPVLLEIPEDGYEELVSYLKTGFEDIVDRLRAGKYARAQDLLELALEQFVEYGEPTAPIRSTLSLLKGETIYEQALVAKHIKANLVLDFLEDDEEFYGEEIPQPTVDGLIVEEPLAEELIETTSDFPIARVIYVRSTDHPNLITGIELEPMFASDEIPAPLQTNALYILRLLYQLLAVNARN